MEPSFANKRLPLYLNTNRVAHPCWIPETALKCPFLSNCLIFLCKLPIACDKKDQKSEYRKKGPDNQETYSQASKPCDAISL